MSIPPARIGKPRQWQLRLAAASFVLMWCSGYPIGKIAVQHAGPLTTLLWRFGAAALIFAAMAIAARVEWPAWRALLHSAIVGVLSLAVLFGGIYEGLRLGVSTGTAALIIGALPLATALLATLSGEELERRQWLGLALGFVGVVLVLAGHIHGGGDALGYALSVLGLAGLSFGTVYQKRYATTIDLRVSLAVQHAAAALVMLPLAWSLEHFHADWSLPYIGTLAWIVAVNAVGGFGLMAWLLREGVATDVAALFYLMPPITALMGWIIFDERLTMTMLPGFVLVAVGVWLGTRMAVSRDR